MQFWKAPAVFAGCRRLDAVVSALRVLPHLLEEHEVVPALEQLPQIDGKGCHSGGQPLARARAPGLPAAVSLGDELGWLAALVGNVGR